jgi:hypothetical protein
MRAKLYHGFSAVSLDHRPAQEWPLSKSDLRALLDTVRSAATGSSGTRHPSEQYSIAASASFAHSAAWGAGTTTHSFIGRPPIGSNRCAPGILRACA